MLAVNERPFQQVAINFVGGMAGMEVVKCLGPAAAKIAALVTATAGFGDTQVLTHAIITAAAGILVGDEFGEAVVNRIGMVGALALGLGGQGLMVVTPILPYALIGAYVFRGVHGEANYIINDLIDRFR